MTSMPRENIEEQHQAMPGYPMRKYLGDNARRNRRPIPSADSFEGTVDAELYRGLWIARCPEEPCANACTVTTTDPVYFCPDCGAGWWHVVFPDNKIEIEAEVMKRPVPRKGLVHANWTPGQTLLELQLETLAERNV